MSTPQQNRLSYTPEMVQQLLQQIQIEIQLADRKGRTTAEGRNHLLRARQIKTQLIAFQQQFRQTQNPNGQAGQPGQAVQTGQPAVLGQLGAAGLAARAQGMPAGVPGVGGPAAANVPKPAPGRPTVNVNAANGYQQRFAQIEELRRMLVHTNGKIEQLEAGMGTLTSPESIEQARVQIAQLRTRKDAIRQRENLLMREMRAALQQQTQAQAQAQAQAPSTGSLPSGAGPVAPDGTIGAAKRPAVAPAQRVVQQQQAQMLRGVPTNAQGQPMTAAQVTAARMAQLRALQAKQGAPATAAELQAAAPAQTPRVQGLQVPSHLNVVPPPPAALRAGRPTLTNGGPTEAQALNTPGAIKPPTLELGGDRLLSKRKLTDLVTAVLGPDNEPLIDGDVEELLLELADEFVASVTGFACKLAKHRRSDVLEAKDIHMHLERNWNMHIAGYSSDEIRSIRRFAPLPAYQQKLQNIAMSKSVNKQ